ncbi:MAG: YfhO family protein [Gemmatimonadota bacterium]
MAEAPGRFRSRGTALFLASAAALALLFYGEFVFWPGRMLFGTDMLDQAYQLRQFGVEEIRSGRGFPLWNPFVYGGLPYLAILPGPVFYPTSLLYLVMPLYRAIGWTFVLHTALAGAFAYYAALSLRVGKWAAAVSGLAFMFTGFVVSTLYGGHDGRMFGMVLIPLAFALLERGLASGRVKWFLALGLVVALQIFTPHVQVMYFSSLALSLYALLRIVEWWGEAEEGKGMALRLAGLTALAFVVAALVGTAQLLPTYRILDIAVRGGGGESGYAFASSWALPPQELSALLLPDLIGSLPGLYWGSNPFKLHTEYLGAVPLALALVAVMGGRRDRRVWWLGGISLLGLLFALGAATPVHRVAYAVVPMLGRFRAPSMMLGPVALFIALLAGIGWQRVLDARGTAAKPSRRSGSSHRGSVQKHSVARSEGRRPAGALPWPWIWAASVPILLLAAAAALGPDGLLRWVYHAWYPDGWPPPPDALPGRLRADGWLVLIGWGATLAVARAVARRRIPPRSVLILLLLLVVDQWRVDASYLLTTTPEEEFATDPVIRYLESELEPGERVYPLPGSYRPNQLMTFRIPTLTGNQNFRLEWSERFFGGLTPREYRNLNRPALWGLVDLRYFVSPQRVQPSGIIAPVADAVGKHLARLEADAPHAFFPARVEAARDTAEALRRVLELSDPGELAVVEAAEAPPAGRGEARIESYAPNEIVLRVSAEQGGLLFVSEIFHPSWRAYVDGSQTEVLRTNVAFRGVVVPEGEHELRFTYSAAEFRTGFLISGLSLAAVLLGLGWLMAAERRGKRAGGDGAPPMMALG